MKFTLSGRISRQVHTLVWDDGRLEGSEQTKELFQSEMSVRQGSLWLGDFPVEGGMEAPLAVLALGYELLGPEMKAEGDVPEIPEVPDGAIS